MLVLSNVSRYEIINNRGMCPNRKARLMVIDRDNRVAYYALDSDAYYGQPGYYEVLEVLEKK
jgi:hypothetical protein